MKRRRQAAGADASRRYHDRVARKYDAIYDEPYWEFHDRLTWAAIRQHLPSDLSAGCCDLGCGTGLAGVAFKDMAKRLDGMDLSPAMIAKAASSGIRSLGWKVGSPVRLLGRSSFPAGQSGSPNYPS